ncbi:hydrolethalus syndrome protein 1 [Limosa lapponica baueri]|uniref:RNA helicase n=1 Tax=Limosa lapponica baueri TaxID=1758121 RepID=A0A2I0TCQ9_LIMLA|nr:hydrolethalus syndrome protein 1 [Limosa lapponica baueri]
MEEAPGVEEEEELAATLALSRLYAQRGGSQHPYAEASPALGVQLPPATFPGDRRGCRRLVMKRKVLRRRPDGGVEVRDESVTSETESDTEHGSQRWELPQPGSSPEESISEGEFESSSSSSLDDSPHRWPRGDSPPFLLEDFDRRSSPASQYSAMAGQPKSFIPPRFEPLGRNRGKTDPVAKYFEYKREWGKFRIPGEDERRELRWGIREQMFCRPQLPSKPQHPYVPNAYTVPTEKKRAALRWEVRWDLARGLLPRKNTSSSAPPHPPPNRPPQDLDLAETSLLNKLIRTSLVESSHHVEILQRDPSSPLFSVKTFEELPLKKELLQGIYIMGFNRPSKIQETALPIMLAYPPQNLIAQSQSGTGKTAAFVLAMLSRVNAAEKHPQCLCLAPTYELALQIGHVIESIGQFCADIKVTYAVRGNPGESDSAHRATGAVTGA